MLCRKHPKKKISPFFLVKRYLYVLFSRNYSLVKLCKAISITQLSFAVEDTCCSFFVPFFVYECCFASLAQVSFVVTS